jgi:5-methylcytosine-specific restriction endonuclease McrA
MPTLPPHSDPPQRRPRSPHRGTTTERGYGTAHQALRLQVLAEQGGLCAWCKRVWGTDLHHLDHDSHNQARSNLVVICERCHQDYHRRVNSIRE